MKVLLINGSPRREGNTFIALSEVAKALNDNGVETEIVSIGTKAVQGCIACGRCAELGHCVFSDELYQKNGKSMEYPPNCSRLTQQDLIIRELEEKRRSWADS